jgi:aryl-alcohol dehydrogenase-like predicted oxidoreductase
VKIQKKLCIGTVQLGQSYGPQKNKKIISLSELTKFVNYLKKNKIKYLDTALNYNFDKRIKNTNISLREFKIITKIPSPKKLKFNYKNKIIFDLKKMLSNLNVKSFYAVLLHDSKNLKKNNYLEFLSLVKSLKKMKLIKYYGISIYSQLEFYNFRKYGKPEIVQGQLNIFDQTLLKENFLYKLKKDGIKFHARSIFLQGLLTINYNKLRAFFKKWNKVIIEWNAFCRNKGFSNLEVATNFVLNNSLVDKIVVGFQNKNELKEFLSIKKNLKINNINFKPKNNLNNSNLLKPSKWK